MTNDDYYEYATRFVIDWLDANPQQVYFSGNSFWAAGLQKHGNGRRLGRVLVDMRDCGLIHKVSTTISLDGHWTKIALYRRGA